MNSAARFLVGGHVQGVFFRASTREQALRMFTQSAARAAFAENLLGSIRPGKLADLSILSADIMRIPVAAIPRTRCLMTVINGEIVHRAAS